MMNLLLDTHIFLWYITADNQLPLSWKNHIQNGDNQIYLSAVSIWEITTKYQLGKLNLPEPPNPYLTYQRQLHRIYSLPLDESSVFQLMTLPPYHRDPFDRMLICQALSHHLRLLTLDQQILQYSIPTLPIS